MNGAPPFVQMPVKQTPVFVAPVESIVVHAVPSVLPVQAAGEHDVVGGAVMPKPIGLVSTRYDLFDTVVFSIVAAPRDGLPPQVSSPSVRRIVM